MSDDMRDIPGEVKSVGPTLLTGVFAVMLVVFGVLVWQGWARMFDLWNDYDLPLPALTLALVRVPGWMWAIVGLGGAGMVVVVSFLPLSAGASRIGQRVVFVLSLLVLGLVTVAMLMPMAALGRAMAG